jgi:hypothetical protein
MDGLSFRKPRIFAYSLDNFTGRAALAELKKLTSADCLSSKTFKPMHRAIVLTKIREICVSTWSVSKASSFRDFDISILLFRKVSVRLQRMA